MQNARREAVTEKYIFLYFLSMMIYVEMNMLHFNNNIVAQY